MSIVSHGGSVMPSQQDNPWAIDGSDTQDDGLEPGAYVIRLGCPYVDGDRQYVAVPFDVACGPRKGFFSDWPVSREGFHTKYLSYKPRAKALTAKAVKAIAESNPGLDVLALWNAGDFSALNGRLVGLVVSHREVRSSYDGSVEVMPDYSFVPIEALRTGSYVIPGKHRLDGTRDESVEGVPVDLSELDGREGDEGPDEELWGGDGDGGR